MSGDGPTRETRRNPTEGKPSPDYFLSVPFDGWSKEQINHEVTTFIEESGLHRYDRDFRRGAFLAQSRYAFDNERPDGLKLDEEERERLVLEYSDRKIDKFKQSPQLYALVALCSIGAAVQGWDETAVNGAQIYYQKALCIYDRDWIRGLVNGAPYLCCALSCWLNYPLNYYLGRRGTIFLTCTISCVACLGQAFPQTWPQLFITRFLLGFGIGPKSATIPIYAAEAAPANVRGALVMMWQMWTAFGIMCGFIAGVVFWGVNEGTSLTCSPGRNVLNEICHDPTKASEVATMLSARCSLNWRLMLASPMALPIIVVLYVYTLPESPRWLLRKAQHANPQDRKRRYRKAFEAMKKLRFTEIQAARDLFLINYLLKAEEANGKQLHPFRELFTVGRNRRALVASICVMFLQQFCGVNVLAYYSSDFLADSKGGAFKPKAAFQASMGFGIINFVFALPAVWTIDSFGRRNLLLTTFPLMAIFMLLVAIGFDLPKGDGKTALVLIGMYLFSMAYSPGEGPVPFVYSAESMPLYNRDFGMGIVTGILWFFNFFLAITWPTFQTAYTPAGAFGWYSAWCVVGFFMILLFVPETRNLTLEQLDEVFEKKTSVHMRHGVNEMKYVMERFVMGKKTAVKPVLIAPPEERPIGEYEHDDPGPAMGGDV